MKRREVFKVENLLNKQKLRLFFQVSLKSGVDTSPIQLDNPKHILIASCIPNSSGVTIKFYFQLN